MVFRGFHVCFSHTVPLNFVKLVKQKFKSKRHCKGTYFFVKFSIVWQCYYLIRDNPFPSGNEIPTLLWNNAVQLSKKMAATGRGNATNSQGVAANAKVNSQCQCFRV